jgi:hypothetical protein
MGGKRDERFLSEEEQEQLQIERVTEREMEQLRFSFVEIKKFTQLIGGKVIEFTTAPRSFLFMERNMSVIHFYMVQDSGILKRKFSQLISAVDRIYYK